MPWGAEPHIKGYAASEAEKAAVIIDARVGASSSVASWRLVFAGGMLGEPLYRKLIQQAMDTETGPK